jgi:adenylate cyclase
VPRGYSVLEASRAARIPHQSVCGGRARCSTCRVAVTHGMHGQPPPSPVERAMLHRIGAAPRVRLACQFRPVRDVKVVPLVHAGAAAGSRPGAAVPPAPSAFLGEEREIVVLFCDIRGFTAFAEHRLPFDVVFILNRYFDLVGRAVSEHGGLVDKFVGDGAMALFGLSTSGATAAAQGLAAAERIIADLRGLNEILGRELVEPLRIAIALHQGPAIVGEIGYGPTAGLTAVGDTINVASRLEAAAKAADAELVVSDEVMRRSAASLDGFDLKVLDVRGRSLPLEVWMRGSAHRRTDPPRHAGRAPV